MIRMEEVKDETFANKVLGDGVAVIPDTGHVYAPADGTVRNVFDTRHAICFESVCGTEILIHIGVDTVNLIPMIFTDLPEDRRLEISAPGAVDTNRVAAVIHKQ